VSDTFENPYPPEFGYYRIGTPINADLNRAAPACPAFHMGALAAENCLLSDVNPISVKRIQGGGSDTRSQDAWGFSADASLKLGFFVNASLSCHVSRSRNQSSSSSMQTITAFAKQESGIELRHNVPGDVLLQCATLDFRDKLLAIRNAATDCAKDPETSAAGKAALVRAYKDFYSVYGTGFVSKLVLGAIGVFRGSAVYESATEETRSNYGGGVSVSGFYGGFSAAAEYSNKHFGANAKGSFQGEAFGMPAGSAVAGWAEGFLNQFAEQQLAKLGDLKAWQECFEAPVAKAEPPVIKEREPSTAKVPSFSTGDIDAQIADLQLNEFADAWRKEHGGAEPKGEQYAEWVTRLKRTASEVTAADVALASAGPVADAAAAPAATPAAPASAKRVPADAKAEPAGGGEPAIVRAASPSSGLRMVMLAPKLAEDAGELPGLRPIDAGVHPAYLQAGSFGPAAGAGPDDVDFGGYGIVGYEYTPWVSVFPELKPIVQGVTTSQVSMGLAMAWLSIRETFAQYLNFCARFFPDVAPEGIGAAANAFRLAIDDIGAFIVESFSGPDSNMVSLPELEQRFRQALRRRRFALMRHYEHLIEHYAWLARVPFGAVPVADAFDRYYYQPYRTTIDSDKPQYRHGSIAKIEFPAATLFERGALRLYPVLHEKFTGEIGFFWINVEIVRLGGKEYRVGASILNEPRQGLSGQFDWGMCRILGTTGTPGFLASQASTPNLMPSFRPGEPVWRLNASQAPRCRIWARVVAHGALGIGGFMPGEFELGLDYRLAVGSVGSSEFKPESFNYRGSQGQNAFELCLVPVDYADAAIADEPPGGFAGGGPMWVQPRTDAIIEAINALGR